MSVLIVFLMGLLLLILMEYYHCSYEPVPEHKITIGYLWIFAVDQILIQSDTCHAV